MYRSLLHISQKITVAMALLLMVLIPVSCSDKLDGTQEYGCCNVGLRLTLDEISSTKAPSGSYDDGRSTPYENYINVAEQDFKVLLFEPIYPYKLASEIQNIKINAVEADRLTSKTYLLLGNVPATMKSGSYKVVFLANWKGCGGHYPAVTPGITTIDDIANGSSFNYAADFSLGPGRGIPMYGVKDCENLTFEKDLLTDFGRMHLLRAMAKVEVKASETGLPLKSATLTRSYNSGLAAPLKIYRQEDYVRGSYINDYLDSIHLPDTPSVIESLPFTKKDDGSFVIYLPEYDNTSASATASQIHLVFDASDSFDEILYEEDIDFKYYSMQAALDAGKNLGDKFDVKRNHCYIYTVTKKIDPGIRIVVDVIPYSSVELDPEFGL